MVMMRVFSAMAAAALLVSQGQAAETKFALSGDNTKVTFTGHKPDGKHEGGFKAVAGSATVDGADIATLKIAVEIDMNSTFTDDEKLTAHLKSPDFFGVKANPKSKFVSSKVAKTDAGYTVTGKLTMNGKTKDISFPAKIDISGGTLALSASFKIDRNNWDISYGKGKVNDEVDLGIALSAKK
jgi:polyisoprenoid-binding protein YceI